MADNATPTGTPAAPAAPAAEAPTSAPAADALPSLREVFERHEAAAASAPPAEGEKPAQPVTEEAKPAEQPPATEKQRLAPEVIRQLEEKRERVRAEKAAKEERAKLEAEKAEVAEIRAFRDALKAGDVSAIERFEAVTGRKFDDLLLAYAEGKKPGDDQGAVAKKLEAEVAEMRKQLADRQAAEERQRNEALTREYLGQIRAVTSGKDEFALVESEGLHGEVLHLVALAAQDPDDPRVLPWEEAARLVEAQAREQARAKFERLQKIFAPPPVTPTPVDRAAGTDKAPTRPSPSLSNSAATSAPVSTQNGVRPELLSADEFREFMRKRMDELDRVAS